jgi:hypothetical protein
MVQKATEYSKFAPHKFFINMKKLLLAILFLNSEFVLMAQPPVDTSWKKESGRQQRKSITWYIQNWK